MNSKHSSDNIILKTYSLFSRNTVYLLLQDYLMGTAEVHEQSHWDSNTFDAFQHVLSGCKNNSLILLTEKSSSPLVPTETGCVRPKAANLCFMLVAR